jgi:hypothetical protein
MDVRAESRENRYEMYILIVTGLDTETSTNLDSVGVAGRQS